MVPSVLATRICHRVATRIVGSATRCSVHRRNVRGASHFSTQIDENTTSGDSTLSSPKLQELFDSVVKLPEEEVNMLGAMVIQVLGRTVYPGQFRPVPGSGGGLQMAAAAEEEVEAEVAKTSFDLKLVGFDAKAKIKVIKEVRAIAGLGLKEAKELVESAPKVIQKDLKQDKADELKALLEAVGAQIEIV